MRKLSLIVLVLFMPLFSGCIHFYDYKHYRVQVIDPELNQPVENASIAVTYPNIGVAEIRGNKPSEIKTITDVNGYAIIKVAKPGPHVNIGADGYLSFSETYPFFYSRIPEVFRIANDGRVIIPLYRKPEPKIE